MQETQERTPEAARAEIDTLPLDGEFLSILQDPAHPGHKAAAARRRTLYDAAYPARTGPDKHSNEEIADNTVNPDRAGASIFDAPPSPQAYRFDATSPGLKPA